MTPLSVVTTIGPGGGALSAPPSAGLLPELLHATAKLASASTPHRFIAPESHADVTGTRGVG